MTAQILKSTSGTMAFYLGKSYDGDYYYFKFPSGIMEYSENEVKEVFEVEVDELERPC